MGTLNLDSIVDVVVDIAAPATPRNGFNIGLIMGPSTAIAPASRCKQYASSEAMLEDGFAVGDAEYKAAVLYFAQTPSPKFVAIGAWDSNQESLVEAIQACRAVDQTWYAAYACGASEADHKALATWIAANRLVYFYNSTDNAAVDSGSADIFSQCKALSAKRVFGLYSQFPHAAAAVMGFAMGANSRSGNSAYTLAYKSLAGVTPDDLNENDISILKGKCANVYVTRGGVYNLLEQGIMADGTPFDEIIGLDRLSNDIQLAVMDLLANTKTKIPHTDAGMVQFIAAINGELDAAAERGFIAPGVWTGPAILELETGDALETGYWVQAESVDSQTQAERAQRKAPSVYVCAKLAGAIENIVVKINIDR